jgi:acyl dehydratase
MTSLYYDDLHVGTELSGGSRTVTDAEVALLPAIMGVTGPLFHDELTARQRPFGRRVLYGPALLGIAIALTESCFHEAVLGLVSITDVRFRRPVGVADTVTASLTVLELSTRPDRPGGKVTVQDQVRNQDGELVLEFRRALLLRLRVDQPT